MISACQHERVVTWFEHRRSHQTEHYFDCTQAHETSSPHNAVHFPSYRKLWLLSAPRY